MLDKFRPQHNCCWETSAGSVVQVCVGAAFLLRFRCLSCLMQCLCLRWCRRCWSRWASRSWRSAAARTSTSARTVGRLNSTTCCSYSAAGLDLDRVQGGGGGGGGGSSGAVTVVAGDGLTLVGGSCGPCIHYMSFQNPKSTYQPWCFELACWFGVPGGMLTCL